MQPLSVPCWFLVFEHAESMWWHRWLRPGFAHCWAFGFSPRGGWVRFEPCFDRLDVRVCSLAEVDGWLGLAHGGRLTVLRMPVVGERVLRPRWVVTCAGALAALVGMRATPLTPWGLACRARALGAEEIGRGQSVQRAEVASDAGAAA